MIERAMQSVKTWLKNVQCATQEGKEFSEIIFQNKP